MTKIWILFIFAQKKIPVYIATYLLPEQFITLENKVMDFNASISGIRMIMCKVEYLCT